MNNETHISSLIVYARPGSDAVVADALGRFAGVEIHAAGAAGKIIITLECPAAAVVMDTVEQINRIPGVVNAVLVYHHCESSEALEEEVIHENDPS